MSNHTDPKQAKNRPVEMRQDYYGGNLYENPDPPTFHQTKGIHWGILGVLLFCITFWGLIALLIAHMFTKPNPPQTTKQPDPIPIIIVTQDPQKPGWTPTNTGTTQNGPGYDTHRYNGGYELKVNPDAPNLGPPPPIHIK